MKNIIFDDGVIFIGGWAFVTILKQMESRFQAIPRFFRINKSLIINLDCIQQIEKEKISLQNGQSFVPSRRRKNLFLN